jgi:4-hydroxybenzoyl-CoA thioesterase
MRKRGCSPVCFRRKILYCLSRFENGKQRVTNFVNRRQFTIDWAYCDPAGIVFNSRFFEFFDTSTWQLFEAALGVKPHNLMTTFDIAGIPLVDARAKFMLPAKFGDLVEMHSNVGEFRRSSFNVEHRLMVDGKLAVEGVETRVWAGVDKDNPSQLKSRPIPEEVMARFKPA